MLYLPKWIYEVLPIIYLISGLMALVGTDNNLGRASGLLLFLAAALIVWLRWNIRQTARHAASGLVSTSSVTYQYRNG